MIKNFWNNIRIFCGNHRENHTIELMPHEGAEGMDMFYSCPKYYPESRSEDEKACGNRINLIEYQKMVEYLSDKIEDAEEERKTVNLTGYQWSNKRGITFTVLRHDKEHIDVLVYNKRALGK